MGFPAADAEFDPADVERQLESIEETLVTVIGPS
jgi:hypothetical protein